MSPSTTNFVVEYILGLFVIFTSQIIIMIMMMIIIIMSNRNIANNGVKEAGISSEGPSPGSLRMQGQVPGSRNQATANKTPLNADNEDNVMFLGEEEWKDLFGNSMYGNYKF